MYNHITNSNCGRSKNVSLAGAATRTISVTTKLLSLQIRICRDKHFSKINMLAATKLCLLFCRNKTVVMTNICCDKHMFVTTKVLS